MRIDFGQHQRMSQQMKLSPRMIQSMEILQMASQALEARIEQELSSNPTLELEEPEEDPTQALAHLEQARRDDQEGERELVVSDDATHTSQADDFERLGNISEEYGDTWSSNTYETASFSSRRVQNTGERDPKLDAMANAAARPRSLTDQLLDQWRLVDQPPAVLRAGAYLISFIDDDGYLRTDWQTIVSQAPRDVATEFLETALFELQHTLEPVGLAARDVRECLLLQIDARQALNDRRAAGQGNHDEKFSRVGKNQSVESSDLRVERELVSKHLADLEANRLPRIAKALNVSIDRVKEAIVCLKSFYIHPGRLLIETAPPVIQPDAIVEYNEQDDCYVATLCRGQLPSIRINRQYEQMGADKAADSKTRQFINANLQSARWLIDAIHQRDHTLMRVICSVLEAQRDFFDLGPQALKPLPMTQVAEQLGIHVATVSRAVSDKFLQTPRGIFPLRMFFSGGTETESGQAMSWAAIQSKLQEIIDAEDKQKPLSDDALVAKLKEQGIEIARRTVAKYRKQLHIPSARQRREY